MKAFFSRLAILALVLFFSAGELLAQCSICTRTASQLGRQAGEGFNSGIVYLAIVPFAIVGVIGYKWYKNLK